MSSRALRRLQKQRELEQQESEQESASDTDLQDLKPSKPAFNAFDLLEAHDANEEESDVDEAPVEDTPNAEEPVQSPKPSSSKRKKQKKKKGKKGAVSADAKLSGAATPNDAGFDDIDLALKELSIKQTGEIQNDLVAGPPGVANDEREATLCALLAIDSKKLNAMNEMKKLFGSAAIEGRYSDGGEQSPGRRRDRNRQALDLGRALTGRFNPASRGQDLSGMTLRKNILMQGKDEWPRATSGGSGMEVVKKEPSGVTEYKLVHNAVYEDVQRQFDICVQSMQPERMIEHLQFNRESLVLFLGQTVMKLTAQ